MDYKGPADLTGPGVVRLGTGVWITSGRAVVIEGRNALALVDPGDEQMGSPEAPEGPLADLLELCRDTGKRLSTVLVTHGHPDHVANLPLLKKAGKLHAALAGFKVLAHPSGPLSPDRPLAEREKLEEFGLEVIPSPGHSPWGDDLSFHHGEAGILFSGDLVQPKGETWEEAFYPSPYPWFTDGDLYLSSLAKLEALRFSTLVTGHREVRKNEAATRWVSLTQRAIEAVRDKVLAAPPGALMQEESKRIYRELAAERNIDEGATAQRMAPAGSSSFDLYDMAGIRYWLGQRPAE